MKTATLCHSREINKFDFTITFQFLHFIYLFLTCSPHCDIRTHFSSYNSKLGKLKKRPSFFKKLHLVKGIDTIVTIRHNILRLEKIRSSI